MKHQALKHIKFFLIVTYMFLLVIGAWFQDVRPDIFNKPSSWAFDFIGYLGSLPGINVFYEKQYQQKLIATCTIIEGIKPDGTQVRIYEHKSCNPHKIQWHYYGNDIYYFRFSNEVQYLLLNKRFEKGYEFLQKLFNHYCVGMSQIKYNWTRVLEDYDSGIKSNSSTLSYKWDCKKQDYIK